MRPFIDLHALALDETVVRIASFLRSRFSCWVGITSSELGAIPLTAEGTGPPLPACRLFMRHPLHHEGRDTISTCQGDTIRWGGHTEEQREVRCHAGFHAIVHPVSSSIGTIGTLYASGWTPQSSEAASIVDIRRALGRIHVDPLDIDTLTETIASHPEGRQSAIRALLDFIASRMATLIDERLDEGSAPSPSSMVYCGMIGQSPKMRALFEMIERIAPTRSTILILGENGTGKELVAKALHTRSRRADRPFVAQNCAALPADLIESELFGHKRGAFSGAHRDREGLFEVADHGTFFLDEIGEMDLRLQTKMLRVLQEGTFLPIGDTTHRKVDVRTICATNRELVSMVERGEFRQDLYYRINVISLRVPALRERPTDIPLLAHALLSRACVTHARPPKTLHVETLQRLTSYAWPGNVRELVNEIERLVILTDDADEISPDALSPKFSGNTMGPIAFSMSDLSMPDAVEQLERQMILDALEETGWNKTKAAKKLGVSRRNLIRKVQAFELE